MVFFEFNSNDTKRSWWAEKGSVCELSKNLRHVHAAKGNACVAFLTWYLEPTRCLRNETQNAANKRIRRKVGKDDPKPPVLSHLL